MKPRWHILFGVILTALFWIASPKINLLYLTLLFLSTFLIDFDHYVCAVKNTKKWGLSCAFEYHEKTKIEEKRLIAKGIKKKGDFHIFHTIETHILIGILSLFWGGFFYIFLGMVFHSLLDVYSMMYEKNLHVREFFFFKWIYRQLTKN